MVLYRIFSESATACAHFHEKNRCARRPSIFRHTKTYKCMISTTQNHRENVRKPMPTTDARRGIFHRFAAKRIFCGIHRKCGFDLAIIHKMKGIEGFSLAKNRHGSYNKHRSNRCGISYQFSRLSLASREYNVGSALKTDGQECFNRFFVSDDCPDFLPDICAAFPAGALSIY